MTYTPELSEFLLKTGKMARVWPNSTTDAKLYDNVSFLIRRTVIITNNQIL